MKRLIILVLVCVGLNLLLAKLIDVKPFIDKSDVIEITKKTNNYTYSEADVIELGTKVVHLVKYNRSGKEVSFASQLIEANKTYVIHDDFVLDEDVTIPANCVLRFEGGSLSNGTLIGNDTRLEGNLNGVFSNITIDANGSWNVPYISTDYFVNISDSATDETQRDRSKDNLIHNVLRMTSEAINNEVFIKGNYWVDVEGDVSNHIAIRAKSNTKYYIQGTIRMISHNYAKSSLIHLAGSHNVVITGGGSLYGDKLRHVYYDGNSYPDGYIPGFARNSAKPSGYNAHGSNHGIYVSGKDIVLDSINIHDITSDGLYINQATNITIKNFSINNARRVGLSVIDTDKLIVENGCIDTVSGTAPEKGIDVEPNSGNKVDRASFRNIYITNVSVGFGVNNTNGDGCNNIIFDSIKVDNCCAGFNSVKSYNVAFRNCEIDAKGRGSKVYAEYEALACGASICIGSGIIIENCIINFNVPYLKTGFDKTNESIIKNYEAYLTYDENDPDVNHADVEKLKSYNSNAYVISNTNTNITIRDNTIRTNVLFLRDREKACKTEGNTVSCRYPF